LQTQFQASMLWFFRRISQIFADFCRFSPILADFCRCSHNFGKHFGGFFLENQCYEQFLHKLTLLWVQNANFFLQVFWRKFLLITTLTPVRKLSVQNRCYVTVINEGKKDFLLIFFANFCRKCICTKL
jgi:hypothetical protein